MAQRRISIVAVVVMAVSVVGACVFLGLGHYVTRQVKQEVDYTLASLKKDLDIRYEQIRVSWLSFRVILHNVQLSGPSLPGKLRIAQVSIRDPAPLGITSVPISLVFHDIQFEGRDWQVNVSHLAATVSLGKPVLLTQDGWPGLVQALRLGSVRLKDLTFSWGKILVLLEAMDLSLGAQADRTGRLALEQGRVFLDQENFNFAGCNLTMSLDKYDTLTRLSGGLRRFNYPLSQNQQKAVRSLQYLQRLGYDALRVDLDLGYVYDAANQKMTCGLTLASPDMGDLVLSVRIGNFQGISVPLQGGLFDTMVFFGCLQKARQDASIESLQADYREKELIKRLIADGAESQRKSLQIFSEDLGYQLEDMVEKFSFGSHVAEQLPAVNRFIMNPNEIKVQLDFPKPVRFSRLEALSFKKAMDILKTADIAVTSK